MNTPAKFQVTSPPFRWDEAGGIRIGSSRVTLDSILASYHNGSTPEEIAIQTRPTSSTTETTTNSKTQLSRFKTALACSLSVKRRVEAKCAF